MNLALLAAAGIAVSYGLATVLQSVGAKSTASSDGLDPGLLVRLLRSVPYLIGLALDGAGFLLTVVALQTLPLFVVEAFTAGALAVTAVAAAFWLKIPLSRGEWAGVAAVVVGLVALGLSAGADEEVALETWQKWLPLGAGILLLLLTFLGAKIGGRWGVTVLGALAGFGFGLVGIATRTLESPITVTGLLTDPSAYGIVVAGAVSLLALATALQRGGSHPGDGSHGGRRDRDPLGHRPGLPRRPDQARLRGGGRHRPAGRHRRGGGPVPARGDSRRRRSTRLPRHSVSEEPATG